MISSRHSDLELFDFGFLSLHKRAYFLCHRGLQTVLFMPAEPGRAQITIKHTFCSGFGFRVDGRELW
jgi:hypothetical protein